jgi:tRNA-dihydrouridine synthase
VFYRPLKNHAEIKMNFWTRLPQHFFALAPMEDVTDTVFRRLLVQQKKEPDFRSVSKPASDLMQWKQSGGSETYLK